MPVRSRLFVPWLALGTVCSVLMWLFPGDETVPYHVAWIGLATAYGLDAWPRGRTVLSIGTFTLVTGLILAVRAATGVIPWDETAEIPLMSILMLLMVWHVHRRQLALAALTEMADRERRRAAQRERLSRMTSHEMRTPTTIAMGYVELLLADEDRAARRADLEVVLDELERLSLATDRLVRMLWIPQQDSVDPVDLDQLLSETADRWSVLADRQWEVTSSAGLQYCSSDRIRACMDTLIENAVRYTAVGDVVRLVSEVRDDAFVVGVTDSGPGLAPELREAVNDVAATEGLVESTSVADPKAQTGLGLGLVREAVVARGGTIVAGTCSDGGASVMMVMPREAANGVAASRTGDGAAAPAGELRTGSPVPTGIA
jgi:two-component system OmpR family sensor kinase